MQHTGGEYEVLLLQIEDALGAESDLIANIATVTALLFEGIEAVDWVGVYFVRGQELVLGPFQGRLAPARIPLAHPTVGRAVREARSIVVEDLASYISPEQDLAARSQIVVPLIVHDRIVAVLQLDSPFVHRFSEQDRVGLERAANLLLTRSDIEQIEERRPLLGIKRRPKTAATSKPPMQTVRGETQGAARQQRTPATEYRSTRIPQRRWLFRIIGAVLAAVLFAMAMSGALYEATSPTDLPWHVLLRKLYSIVAFALVAAVIRFGWRFSITRVTVILAAYSTAIEIGQMFAGSHEGLFSNAIDIVCGAIGGYLGATMARGLVRTQKRR